MKRSFCFLLILALAAGVHAWGQSRPAPAGVDIQTVQFYRAGDQTSFPALVLGSGETLELHFDDLGTDVRNFSYTLQLCNADWTPSMLSTFDYLRGFQQVRITNYRASSIASTRYVHYQATVPDRNSQPTRSGNYLLKVFVDGDTTRLAFTRRFVVVSRLASVSAQVQQPFQAQAFRTGQKLQIIVQTDRRMQLLSPNDLKVVVLQNGNWRTGLRLDRPTIYRGNYYEYSDEVETAMPALREFRWLDLRSLRLKSDRMQDINTRDDTTEVWVKPDLPRVGQSYVFYRDLNGSFVVETLENVNPFWQGEYAWVHFRYVPPGGRMIPGQDLYLFGELTRFAADTSARLQYNAAEGVYEKTLFLKQGFYNYAYMTQPRSGAGQPDFSQTEGDHWSTENSYTILVYYRPFGARADELVGYTTVNSILERRGF